MVAAYCIQWQEKCLPVTQNDFKIRECSLISVVEIIGMYMRAKQMCGLSLSRGSSRRFGIIHTGEGRYEICCPLT